MQQKNKGGQKKSPQKRVGVLNTFNVSSSMF